MIEFSLQVTMDSWNRMTPNLEPPQILPRLLLVRVPSSLGVTADAENSGASWLSLIVKDETKKLNLTD